MAIDTTVARYNREKKCRSSFTGIAAGEARRVAAYEGVALNQFINVAVAEKLSALRTENYFRERAGRASISKAKRLLKRAGKNKPPVPSDEL